MGYHIALERKLVAIRDRPRPIHESIRIRDMGFAYRMTCDIQSGRRTQWAGWFVERQILLAYWSQTGAA
jgi:hypothetical protein